MTDPKKSKNPHIRNEQEASAAPPGSDPSTQDDPSSKQSSEEKTSGGEYKTGYCKPPKSGQFKPGQSGNPKGRPRGPRTARESVQKKLDEKVTIRKNGTQKTVSLHEAIAELLGTQALSSNPQERISAIRALKEFGGADAFSGDLASDEDEASGLARVFEKLGLPSPDPVTPKDYVLSARADKDLGEAKDADAPPDQADPSAPSKGETADAAEAAQIPLTHPDPDIDPTIRPQNQTGYPTSTKLMVFATCWQRRYIKHGDVQRSCMHSRMKRALEGRDIYPGNPELTAEEEAHLAWLNHHSSP